MFKELEREEFLPICAVFQAINVLFWFRWLIYNGIDNFSSVSDDCNLIKKYTFERKRKSLIFALITFVIISHDRFLPPIFKQFCSSLKWRNSC